MSTVSLGFHSPATGSECWESTGWKWPARRAGPDLSPTRAWQKLTRYLLMVVSTCSKPESTPSEWLYKHRTSKQNMPLLAAGLFLFLFDNVSGSDRPGSPKNHRSQSTFSCWDVILLTSLPGALSISSAAIASEPGKSNPEVGR